MAPFRRWEACCTVLSMDTTQPAALRPITAATVSAFLRRQGHRPTPWLSFTGDLSVSSGRRGTGQATVHVDCALRRQSVELAALVVGELTAAGYVLDAPHVGETGDHHIDVLGRRP